MPCACLDFRRFSILTEQHRHQVCKQTDLCYDPLVGIPLANTVLGGFVLKKLLQDTIVPFFS